MDIFIILCQDTYATEEINYEAKSLWMFVLIYMNAWIFIFFFTQILCHYMAKASREILRTLDSENFDSDPIVN